MSPLPSATASSVSAFSFYFYFSYKPYGQNINFKIKLSVNGIGEIWNLFSNSGQSYKAFTIIIYDYRVVPDLKIPHITTLEL